MRCRAPAGLVPAGGALFVDDGRIVWREAGSGHSHLGTRPPTTRLGRALMKEIKRCARQRGFEALTLDTATNQPEAMAFYRGREYRELGRETRPDWSWTLVYDGRSLASRRT